MSHHPHAGPDTSCEETPPLPEKTQSYNTVHAPKTAFITSLKAVSSTNHSCHWLPLDPGLWSRGAPAQRFHTAPQGKPSGSKHALHRADGGTDLAWSQGWDSLMLRAGPGAGFRRPVVPFPRCMVLAHLLWHSVRTAKSHCSLRSFTPPGGDSGFFPVSCAQQQKKKI